MTDAEKNAHRIHKVRYDLAYIANWSLWLDCTILLRTVKVILTSPSV